MRSGRSTADASATEPTASGPTASDLTAAERAERLVRDPRATDQIALDALVELIRLGTTADDGTVHEFGPGDGFVIPVGWAGTWHMPVAVRKTYVILDPAPSTDAA